MKYHICNMWNHSSNEESAPDIIYDIYFRCMGVKEGSDMEFNVLSDILGQAWVITRDVNEHDTA